MGVASHSAEAAFNRFLQSGACRVSAVLDREGPTMGGSLYTSTVYSIGAIPSVLYIEVVLWWEGRRSTVVKLQAK